MPKYSTDVDSGTIILLCLHACMDDFSLSLNTTVFTKRQTQENNQYHILYFSSGLNMVPEWVQEHFVSCFLAFWGDKLPSPSIKHPCSRSNWEPPTPAWEVSHLLLCWYHSSGSLAKINQIFWKALYPLLRYLTDVRQTWLHLSLWRMLGCWTWTNASIPAEAAGIDKHGPSVSILYFSVVAKPFPKGFLFINSLQRSKCKQCRLH